MLPNKPKSWLDGESLDALDFNTQLDENIDWLRKRNIDRLIVRNGISDQSLTVAAGWQPLLPTVFTVKLNTTGGDIMISATLGLMIGGASGTIALDCQVKSSNIDTPFFLSTNGAAHNYFWYEQYTTNYTMKKAFKYLWIDVPIGEYQFTLWWRAEVGTASINYTNTINEFIVEEYCKL